MGEASVDIKRQTIHNFIVVMIDYLQHFNDENMKAHVEISQIFPDENNVDEYLNMMKDAVNFCNDTPMNTEQIENLIDSLVGDINKFERIYSTINFFARLLPPEQMDRILVK